MCLFRFNIWINDPNDGGKLLITSVCLASVNCRPRTAVAGVVREYCSVPGLIFAGLSIPDLSLRS